LTHSHRFPQRHQVFSLLAQLLDERFVHRHFQTPGSRIVFAAKRDDHFSGFARP
jgi:hypothetical protein